MYWTQNIGHALLDSLWQSAIGYIVLSFFRKSKHSSPAQTYWLGISFQIGLCILFFINVLTPNTNFQNSSFQNSNISNLLSNSYISIAYIILLFLNLIFFLNKYYKDQRIKQSNSSFEIPFELTTVISNWKSNLNIKRSIQVVINEVATSPFTTGFIKPVIVLPLSFINHLDCSQMEAVLLHEIWHIKRYDYLFLLSQIVMEKIMYFNPFFLQIGKAIHEDRELSCDLAAINLTNYKSNSYIKTLLLFAQENDRGLTTQLSITGKQNTELFNRASYILEGKRNIVKTSISLQMVALAAFLFSLFSGGNVVIEQTNIPEKLAIIPITENNTAPVFSLGNTNIINEQEAKINKRHFVNSIDNKQNRKYQKNIAVTKTTQKGAEQLPEINGANRNTFVRLASYIQPNNHTETKWQTMEISNNKAVFVWNTKDLENGNGLIFEKLVRNINNRFPIERTAYQYAASVENGIATETYVTELQSSDYNFLLVKGKEKIYLAITPARELKS